MLFPKFPYGVREDMVVASAECSCFWQLRIRSGKVNTWRHERGASGAKTG